MDIRNGAVAMDINQKFNSVLGAVLETAGKGELTIKLLISPSKMGMGGAVIETEVSHECKVKRPELKIGSGFFFVTAEGELSRDDPAQVNMFNLSEEKTDVR